MNIPTGTLTPVAVPDGMWIKDYVIQLRHVLKKGFQLARPQLQQHIASTEIYGVSAAPRDRVPSRPELPVPELHAKLFRERKGRHEVQEVLSDATSTIRVVGDPTEKSFRVHFNRLIPDQLSSDPNAREMVVVQECESSPEGGTATTLRTVQS